MTDVADTENRFKIIYVTCGNEKEALKIIRHIIQKRLVACANLLPTIKSLYWWNDKVQEDHECAFIAKTTTSNIKIVTNEIIKMHSYECPCVITLPIESGNPDFLKWIENETSEK